VHRVEFTIEPFVEGRPGPHVTASIDALRALGVDVEIGPFGSACHVDPGRTSEIVSVLTATALANGASHVNIDVTAGDRA
jgi:uncharacterized protein YqgV (UPF0045/DUF77 family)